jgi:4-amino-4-deoxychorismate lyase
VPAESTLRDRQTAGFELIETLRWEPDAGFVRLERHLARLQASATNLGFRLSLDDAKAALYRAVAGAEPQRMRLTLAFDGAVAASAQPFEPLAEGTVWRLALATSRLSSNDELLRHKTTRRHVYEAARSEYPPTVADEVILLNECAEVCEGTITTVFVDRGHGGPLLTPALSCGLLAGILRGEMLDDGEAVEKVMTMSDLTNAKAIFVGNSLRGLIRAQLVQ